MAISASQVKELRDKTGAGMMDCKKALSEADGDFEKAVEILRKKGASVAAKRAERTANEGIVLTKIIDDGKTGIIVEVNCETDFVASSEDFLNFANFILSVVEKNKPANVDALLDLELDGKKVSAELTDIIGKIGEKIEVSRFSIEHTDNGLVVDYVHHGAKLAVLIKADNIPAEKKDEFGNLLKDIAMQAAAMKPQYLSREDVPAVIVEKEKEIYKEVASKEGKPENILDRIAEGKLNKFYEEVCLTDQAFIKENSKKVGELINDFNKVNSAQAKLVLFHRYHLSDEKK
ncbi:MAG: translation elongation factor Ts [Bacteroidetes bacterium]|nr:translation elongation factor Ts [Bacteroidota bacterium]